MWALQLGLVVSLGSCVFGAESPPKPHILLIVADDYGWGNFGLHTNNSTSAGARHQKEVHTPTLDALANSGILLDRHYAYKICSPSRCALQSGRLAVHVNTNNTGPTVRNVDDPVSGFAGIPRNMTGIAQKLKDQGYYTAMVGKWDAGLATPSHTPKGRGYDEFFGYFQHANQYWNKGNSFQSTGGVDNCLNLFHDLSEHNASYAGGVLDVPDLSAGCANSTAADPACYEEELFKRRSLAIIQAHDPTTPLFLIHAFHIVHTPLQIPLSYLAIIDELVKPDYFDDDQRRTYAAMVYYMDKVVGLLVQAFKDQGLWDNTLMIFCSDNGGAIYLPAAGNNHPLKGGKYSDWEGGHRTNAFVSGGFVPDSARGTVYDGMVSIADWYGVLCDVSGANVTDETAAIANVYLKAHGLPLLHDVDSTPNLWSAITSQAPARTELHLSAKAFIAWPYKLIIGQQPFSTWQGEVYPNCSTGKPNMPWFVDTVVFDHSVNNTFTTEEYVARSQVQDCGNGMLFNIEEDPFEHQDLSQEPQFADKLKSMQSRLDELNQDLFEPERGGTVVEACKEMFANGGYYGPFVDSETYYTGPFPHFGTEEERLLVDYVNQPDVVQSTVERARVVVPAISPILFERFDFCRNSSHTTANDAPTIRDVVMQQLASGEYLS